MPKSKLAADDAACEPKAEVFRTSAVMDFTLPVTHGSPEDSSSPSKDWLNCQSGGARRRMLKTMSWKRVPSANACREILRAGLADGTRPLAAAGGSGRSRPMNNDVALDDQRSAHRAWRSGRHRRHVRTGGGIQIVQDLPRAEQFGVLVHEFAWLCADLGYTPRATSTRRRRCLICQGICCAEDHHHDLRYDGRRHASAGRT